MSDTHISHSHILRNLLVPLAQLVEILPAATTSNAQSPCDVRHAMFDPLSLVFKALLRISPNDADALHRLATVLEEVHAAVGSGFSGADAKAAPRLKAQLRARFYGNGEGAFSHGDSELKNFLARVFQSPAWIRVLDYLEELGAMGHSRHAWLGAQPEKELPALCLLRQFGLRHMARNTPLSGLVQAWPVFNLDPEKLDPLGFMRTPAGVARAEAHWQRIDNLQPETEGATPLPPSTQRAVPEGLDVKVNPATGILLVTAKANALRRLKKTAPELLEATPQPWPKFLTNLAAPQTRVWEVSSLAQLPEAISQACAWQTEQDSPERLHLQLQVEQRRRTQSKIASLIAGLTDTERDVLEAQLRQDMHRRSLNSEVTRYVVTAVVDPKTLGTVGLTKLKGPDKLLGRKTFPGGKIEPGETPEVAATRELKQEVGLAVDSTCWVQAGYLSGAKFELYLMAAWSTDVHTAQQKEEEPIWLSLLPDAVAQAKAKPDEFVPDFLELTELVYRALAISEG